MKVSLIEYTGNGIGEWHAADILIFTKSTRLNKNMNADLLNEIKQWPIEKKLEELEYMSNTIPSSWEFVDYIFAIEGVGRGFTHQFVRTRTGSYAQQSMRVTDMSGFEFVTGDKIKERPALKANYEMYMSKINTMYNILIQMGAEIQDARGILPTNIATNIVAKFNLRTLSEMASKRSSIRTQDEYRAVLDGIIESVLIVHPWAKFFLRNRKMDAAKKLEQFVISQCINKEEQTNLIKCIDMLRG